MKQRNAMNRILRWMESITIIKSLRRGMTLLIPFIMAGALSLALNNLPIPEYQEWIQNFWGGNISYLLTIIYKYSMGILSLLFILFFSYSYASETDSKKTPFYMVCTVCSFLIMVNDRREIMTIEVFDSLNFTYALLIAILSCVLLKFTYRICKKVNLKLYSEGSDVSFQRSINAIVPAALVLILFAGVNLLLHIVRDSLSNEVLAFKLILFLFEKMGSGLISAVIFLLVNHVLWIFGIHGDNVLIEAAKNIFEKGLAVNTQMLADHKIPTEIFTNTFFNTFILCGGTGATICLVIAIFIVSKRREKKRLAWLSILPVAFNINESIIFGLPIILNPIMAIPFILTPIMMLLTSSAAMFLGIVPVTVKTVAWTTPVIWSGILTTNSIAGGILQAVNIAIGTLIYIPFVRLSERHQCETLKEDIDNLNKKIMKAEADGEKVSLLDDNANSTAMMLVSDLRHAIKNKKWELFYQPQICSDKTILGAEALLRWRHPLGGFIYPPLIIELAREEGLLDDLGIHIIAEAAEKLEYISKKIDVPFKMSVNISPIQLEHPDFCDNVIQIVKKHDFGKGILAIEVTEQIALATTPIILKRIERLQNAGILFIMDDYGMGHSSAMYLKNSKFAYVKLDGSLVKELLVNIRIESIVRSIKQLSAELGFELIAEYVETEEQKSKLEELGCHVYQGWLYSKAVEFGELENYINHSNET